MAPDLRIQDTHHHWNRGDTKADKRRLKTGFRSGVPSGVLSLIAVWLVANGVSTFSLTVTTGRLISLVTPAPSGFLLLALLLSGELAGRRIVLRRVAAVCAVIIAAILMIYGFGEIVTQTIYQRDFDLRSDISFVSVGVDLFLPHDSAAADLLETVIILVTILLATTFSYVILRISRRILSGSPGISRVFLGVLVAMFIAFLTSFIIGVFTTYDPISFRIARSIGLGGPKTLVELVSSDPGSVRQPVTPIPQNGEANGETTLTEENPYVFRIIKDADIHLFFFESYGYTAYSRSELFDGIESTLISGEKALTDEGFAISSAFLESPVSGGFSWLAEATFLTGLRIASQTIYDELLTTRTESLPRLLKNSGYTTIVSMPGIVKGEWPEGISFYSFDRHLYSWDFGYAGPIFSYVAVPDQFSMWKTARLIESLTTRSPVYAEYILVSSHAPFNRIPPIIEPWENLGDGSIYNTLEVRAFDNNWLRGNEYDEGYIAAITYVLHAISGYIIEYLKDDEIIIIVGDHQPKRPVREPGAGKSVPIHLVSRQKPLIGYFEQHGFVPGLIPDQPLPHPDMSEFFPMLRTLLRENSTLD